jgi:hypothetical protein
VPDIARVRAGKDAWEFADVLRRQRHANHADAIAQEPIHRLSKLRQLVNQSKARIAPKWGGAGPVVVTR